MRTSFQAENFDLSDIVQWLADLGLEKYVSAFSEAEIDVADLPYLTDEDLKEVGLPVGPRRRVNEAIKRLSRPDSSAIGPTHETPATPETAQHLSSSVNAERRHLTVMFVDLVGSTALSGQLDPEDLRELMRRYQNVVAGEINRMEGYVAKFMGDGVLAYFGWPRTHEDEAERAVRVGLAVTVAVAKLRTPGGSALATRVGIATGLVVVGDVIGEGAAQEEAVVGETPNLAARLQGLAKPGTILISESTRRLLGEVFDLKALGPQTLKGIAAAVNVFRVYGERNSESRYQAQRSGTVLPLIGREYELAQLLEYWQRTQNGEGQMILLTGEAGIGKSRLVRAIGDALKAQPHRRVHYQCSPYHSDSALYPVIRQLTQAAEWADQDTAETKLDKLEALLVQAMDEPGQSALLLAALLGIDGTARYGPLELAPQEQRAQTLQALVAQLAGLAQRQPILFVLEDAHWIDPTTLELVELALDAIRQLPVMLLITARPSFEHHFGDHPRVTRLILSRLAREANLALIRHLGGGKALPDELINEIVGKTDGVPLFVEELTKTILESGRLRETDSAYVLDQPLVSVDIPSSLHDSLMARLDRMPAVREVIQSAACIGREFSYALLAALLPVEPEKLQAALAQLIEAELIFQRGFSPEASYTFKHALVRDAAYESLLKSKRQQIHARIGQKLEQHFTHIVAAEPALLAHHLSEATQHQAAVGYWLKAAQQAHQRFANSEAIAHAKRGLAALSIAGDYPEYQAQELALLTALGRGYRVAFGYAARETEEIFLRALPLAETLDDIDHYVDTARDVIGAYYVGGRFEEGLALAERVLKKTSTPMRAMPVFQIKGALSMRLGRFADARQALEQALLPHDQARLSRLSQQLDPYTLAGGQLGVVLACMGYPEQGQSQHQKAIDSAKALRQPMTLGQSYFHAIISGLLLEMKVTEWVESLHFLSQKHNIDYYEIFAEACRGVRRMQHGELDTGIATTLTAIARLRACQATVNIPFLMAFIVDGCRRAGRLEQGWELLQEARTEMDKTGEDFSCSMLWRVQGELTLLRSSQDTEEAQTCFQQALAVTRQQQAKWLELQAAIALSRLWLRIGKKQQARELLAPLYDWFTEGFEYADLKEAKALLDTLE